MNEQAAILDKDGGIIMDTVITSVKNGNAVMTWQARKENAALKPNEKVCLFILKKYMEFYEGTVEKIEGNTIYMKDFTLQGENKCQDVKVNLNYDSHITFREEGQLKSCLVRVKDISSGGICFFTDVSLNKEMVYEFIVLLTKEPIVLNLKIVRKIYRDDGKGYIYGCKFLDVDPDTEKMLRNTVFWLLGLKYRHKAAV